MTNNTRPPANSAATGAPAITGTAQVGETLTVDTSGIGDDDGLENAAFSYQWLAGDTEIAGATSSAYTLVDADQGKTIKASVTFADDAGNEESLTSAATAAVAARPNSVATGAPRIDGSPVAGRTLTAATSGVADEDGTGNAVSAHQWIRHDPATAAGAEIQGATASSYTATGDDVGKALKVRVTFTDDAGNEESLASAATAAVAARPNSAATGAPSINGSPVAGQTFTAATSGVADEDGLENTTFSYQWLADGSDIDRAKSTTYTLTATDVGKAIKVRVTFTDDAGNEESLTSAATAAVAARPNSAATGAPSIDGSPAVGQTLTAATSGVADEDGLEYTTFSYQWLADGSDIDGATSTTYTLTAADVGKAIKVRVTFTDDAGNEESLTSAATAAVAARPNSAATGAPSIDGSPVVGRTLTASTSGVADEDGMENATFSYQWIRHDPATAAGADIQGATASTYTATGDDVGKALKVRVTFTDDAGNEESLASAATAAVAARPNSAATGAPAISGTAQVGQMLTASTAGINDPDGLDNAVFTYQWLADDTEISGATGSSYTPVATDQGKAIKVRVSFTDDAGNEESLTSAATAAVARPPLTATAHGVPASHNGQGVFTFELRFSEEFGISYRTLRDHAFTVTGGEVVKARRLEPGKNVRWEVHVRPTYNADVTIVLPVTTDCSAQGAVCTEDGRMLSSRLELTVPGPGG